MVRFCCRALCPTLAALGGISWVARAETPIVLYESGATSPIAPYARVLSVRPIGAARTLPRGPAKAPALPTVLPVVTPELSPGDVEARAIQLPHLPRPLFHIGADTRSLVWLEARRARLRDLHVIGLLIQARDEADLRAVTEAAGGLPILPVSGSDIAKQLQLTHYPVLISPDRIEP